MTQRKGDPIHRIDDQPVQGMPGPGATPHYSDRFILALRVAAVGHASQIRKGTDRALDGSAARPVPYIAHPLGVCSIALEYGADEDEAIAALLHDMVEDTEPTEAARATVDEFGPRVRAIVEDCTDGVRRPDGTKDPTEVRKAKYLTAIGGFGRSSLLVSASDKLYNARTIVAALRTHGDETWRRFNLGRDGQLPHYGKLVAAFRANDAHPRELVDELERTVDEMHRLSGVAYAPQSTEAAGAGASAGR